MFPAPGLHPLSLSLSSPGSRLDSSRENPCCLPPQTTKSWVLVAVLAAVTTPKASNRKRWGGVGGDRLRKIGFTSDSVGKQKAQWSSQKPPAPQVIGCFIICGVSCCSQMAQEGCGVIQPLIGRLMDPWFRVTGTQKEGICSPGPSPNLICGVIANL